MFSEQILFVDDEKTILELGRRFLTGEGYAVEVASNGVDALKLLEQKAFNVLLTDVRMPGMSGLELMKLARASYPDLIIMVITGHGTVSTAIEALKLGAMGFILKPFTHQELISMVQHATQKTRLAKENLRLRSLMPLFEVNRRLLGERDPEAVLQKAVEIVLGESRAQKVSLMLLDPQGGGLKVRASAGAVDFDEGVLGRFGAEIAKRAVAQKDVLKCYRSSAEQSELKKLLGDRDFGSGLSFPLIHRKRVIGALNLFNSGHAPAFSESDEELMSILCGQIAVSIENARLYRAIQSNHIRTLEALVAAIELKDLASRGHSSNVAKFAVLLAQRLGMSTEQVKDLALASILHDVGKIGSSDKILAKPEKLTTDELAEMKDHPQKGTKIVESIGLSEAVILAIRHHHERWDGSGYPNGLAQEKIPIYARIIAIADTLDTLMSERPYRKAVSFPEARKEIQAAAGTQFDPKLVDLLSDIDEQALVASATATQLFTQAG